MRTAILLMLLLLPGSAWAHGEYQWIADGDYTIPPGFEDSPEGLFTDGYRGNDGYPCCGPSDCFKVKAENYKLIGDTYHVKSHFDDKIFRIPYSKTYQSEDNNAWLCYKYRGGIPVGPRCFFSGPMGS